jgi:CRISPR/Cas system CMR subunit Cmr4 (Cas7 group RAMP superfamily)
MFDILPFPNISPNKSTEEQVSEINHYLIQFKESLEFILSNISTENLSQELVDKLNSLGAEITKSNEEQEEKVQQAVRTLTVSDVLNSDAFKIALDREYVFRVNFDTGNLEYTKS